MSFIRETLRTVRPTSEVGRMTNMYLNSLRIRRVHDDDDEALLSESCCFCCSEALGMLEKILLV